MTKKRIDELTSKTFFGSGDYILIADSSDLSGGYPKNKKVNASQSFPAVLTQKGSLLEARNTVYNYSYLIGKDTVEMSEQQPSNSLGILTKTVYGESTPLFSVYKSITLNCNSYAETELGGTLTMKISDTYSETPINTKSIIVADVDFSLTNSQGTQQRYVSGGRLTINNIAKTYSYNETTATISYTGDQSITPPITVIFDNSHSSFYKIQIQCTALNAVFAMNIRYLENSTGWIE